MSERQLDQTILLNLNLSWNPFYTYAIYAGMMFSCFNKVESLFSTVVYHRFTCISCYLLHIFLKHEG